MFAMMQLILCAIYLIFFISETTTRNEATACFQKEVKKIIRERDVATDKKLTAVSIFENTKEENFTDKKVPELNNADFIQIQMKSSSIENMEEEEENSTEIKLQEKKSLSHEETSREEKSVASGSSVKNNVEEKMNEEELSMEESDSAVEEPLIILHSLNSEDGKIEEKISNEQKSSIEKNQSKIKVKRHSDDISDKDELKNKRAFLKAFKNCKLMNGEHYIRVKGINTEESSKCVITELQKLENYKGEYTKLLDNSDIVRRE